MESVSVFVFFVRASICVMLTTSIVPHPWLHLGTGHSTCCQDDNNFMGATRAVECTIIAAGRQRFWKEPGILLGILSGK